MSVKAGEGSYVNLYVDSAVHIAVVSLTPGQMQQAVACDSHVAARTFWACTALGRLTTGRGFGTDESRNILSAQEGDPKAASRGLMLDAAAGRRDSIVCVSFNSLMRSSITGL